MKETKKAQMIVAIVSSNTTEDSDGFILRHNIGSKYSEIQDSYLESNVSQRKVSFPKKEGLYMFFVTIELTDYITDGRETVNVDVDITLDSYSKICEYPEMPGELPYSIG